MTLSTGERMALAVRCRELSFVLMPHTDQPINAIMRLVLNDRLWTCIRMIEIAAEHDPEAVIQYALQRQLPPEDPDVQQQGKRERGSTELYRALFDLVHDT